MTRHRAALVLLAFAATAIVPIAPVRAQAFPDSAFDARTGAELRRLLADSRNAGIPEAPLLNRIRQGVARHVSGDRVVGLVRAHADSMLAARAALGTRASADELDAGASALHAGASRSDLRRLRAARPEGTATTAIIVLTDLLWRGVPSSDAAGAITELAGRSSDKALLALQGAVAREGTPASPQRLQSLVDRFATPIPDQPSTTPRPARRPIPPDTLAHEEVRELGASLGVSSLSAPTGDTPRAVFAEGAWALPIGRAWTVKPASALRLDGDGTRWSTALSLSRQIRPLPTLGGRLWLRGELRSPVAHTRSDLPLRGSLDASIPAGRTRDVALLAGTDLQRKVGPWIVTGALALGHARYSALETILVPRLVPVVPDTQTPRPDTLSGRTEFDPQNVWRVLGASTMRGGLSLQRGALRLEGSVIRRLNVGRAGGDSLARPERTLLVVGGERQLSSRLAMVAQWTSHDPSMVTGSLALYDARWRLGLRVAAPTRTVVSLAPARPSGDRDSADDVSVELFADSSTGTSSGSLNAVAVHVVRLRVRMPRARSVQVEGDLTAWAPSALAAAGDGTFTGLFTVASPIVRLRVRADGGAWVTPAGVPTQRDEFGDLVAVYVLPG
jgi:hypothetical protein